VVTVESPETEEFVVFSCARGGDSLSRVRTLVEVSSREGDEPTVVLGRGLIVGGKLGVVPRLTWCLLFPILPHLPKEAPEEEKY
jgi:hypothetical protein